MPVDFNGRTADIKELKEKMENLKSFQSSQEVINDDEPPHY